MGVVICKRCDKVIDLDWCVEGAVVAQDGMTWICVECLDDNEQTILEAANDDPEALVRAALADTEPKTEETKP